MLRTLYIVAGTRKEFDNWVLHSVERYPQTNFVFVDFPDILRGLSNPEGLCIGTWRDRTDIYDILHFLFVAAKDFKKAKAISLLNKEVDNHRKKVVEYKDLWIDG